MFVKANLSADECDGVIRFEELLHKLSKETGHIGHSDKEFKFVSALYGSH